GTLFACSDENADQLIQPAQATLLNNEVSVSDNIVWFKSTEFYSNFVETGETGTKQTLVTQLDENENYVSLRKFFLSKSKISSNGRALSSEEEEVSDTNDFLSSMLNEDGLIGIEDYLFKVNLNDEKVYALPTSQLDQMEDL